MKPLSSLSIVIPCHNEEEVIQDTYYALHSLVQDWLKDTISEYEIVMVNNGSTDNTIEKMKELYETEQNIKIVDLRKNHGFQGSITAGLYHAEMDMIVSIDADLQDDPTKIKEMVQKYYDGYELVLGIRENRKSDTFLKRFTAQLFYKFLNSIGIKSVYNHADYRLISRELLEDFKKFNERNRYIRGMIFELESRYACVYYERTKRKKGRSKFNLFSLTSLALDGITSFSNWPIRLVFFIGLAMFIISLFGIAYALLSKFVFGQKVAGWASTFIIIVFFSGIQNLLLGLVGEYISKIYTEVKERPLFLVRKLYPPKRNKSAAE